jgi:intracellular sulfur oxidation DsrE/DsrF family protein
MPRLAFAKPFAAGLVAGAALLAVVAAPAQQAAPAAAAAAARERAVFAVSDGDAQKWNLTLGNIGNALEALGPDGAQLELVAYGPGIEMLKKDSPASKRVAEAIAKGVRVVACQNSMRGFHLEQADLAPGVAVVPSGVVELMKRQHDGWAYIRS